MTTLFILLMVLSEVLIALDWVVRADVPHSSVFQAIISAFVGYVLVLVVVLVVQRVSSDDESRGC